MRWERALLIASVLFVIGAAYLGLPRFFSWNLSGQGAIKEIRNQGIKSPAGGMGIVAAGQTPGPAATPVEPLSSKDQAAVRILDEIFSTKNDNDPRIDVELKGLSAALKRALFEKYAAIKLEKRNERGTIAFLIGREISSKEDVQFLKSILFEKPCMSLSDCTQPPAPHPGSEDHWESVNETTARYPQLMAMRALTHQYRELSGDPKQDQTLLEPIVSAIREAQNSPDPKIAAEARAVMKEIDK